MHFSSRKLFSCISSIHFFSCCSGKKIDCCQTVFLYTSGYYNRRFPVMLFFPEFISLSSQKCIHSQCQFIIKANYCHFLLVTTRVLHVLFLQFPVRSKRHLFPWNLNFYCLELYQYPNYKTFNPSTYKTFGVSMLSSILLM